MLGNRFLLDYDDIFKTINMTTEETNIQDINTSTLKEDIQYADFQNRLAALFIDFMLIISPLLTFVFFTALNRWVSKLNQWLFKFDLSVFDGFLQDCIVWGVPILIYSLICTLFDISRFQGTPGKIIGKIKVVDIQGNKLTFWRAYGRNMLKVISGIIIFIGFFIALFTVKKQAFHDLVAKTIVIKK